eukprot:CAMPEP_0182921712 /NCGR_PEP_ID=MMETSP0105_2-20130417/4319_1 /TAXON_ID=81532 ORGANISM="Acanthoeca-like sp., Strain 10tr" /NCGR_SAMPLE_ID=MMETSP0105_2 /ASSEMBLY_ACC=CAM_ASM_000205 /LENGTH=105 /DNA_ID=CAMNT_0025059255 /DNA_START=430 /DNA_END=747 /DNA_ORIENTATION=+
MCLPDGAEVYGRGTTWGFVRSIQRWIGTTSGCRCPARRFRELWTTASPRGVQGAQRAPLLDSRHLRMSIGAPDTSLTAHRHTKSERGQRRGGRNVEYPPTEVHKR